MLLHHLHIYVHSRGKRQVGECFNDFWSGIQDVDHSLVHTHQTIEECLNAAYDVISKRTGTMVNGHFLKD